MPDAHEEESRRPRGARPTPVDGRYSEQEEASGGPPLPLSVTPSPAFQQRPSRAAAVVSCRVSIHAATFLKPSSRGRGAARASPGPASPLERCWLQSPRSQTAGQRRGREPLTQPWGQRQGCDPRHRQGRWRRSGRLHGVAPSCRGRCRPNTGGWRRVWMEARPWPEAVGLGPGRDRAW